ncbi:MAG: hypothetical protein K2P92_06875, partial [Bdellovibrionaceae bacterium]|nr:hypothetical protein [Pseudobdellovibrionaceae bacterium]
TLPYSQILVHDKFSVLARYLDPLTMTESFLISGKKVLYRGAIDNQFTLFSTRDENIKTFLKDAVVQTLNSEQITLPKTDPFGCFVSYKNKPYTTTYSYFMNQVVPIIENKCQKCHEGRPGLDFSSYDTLAKFKEMIGYLVQNNIMPPWSAEGSNWKDDLRLSKAEKKTIRRWINSNDTELEKRKAEIVIKNPGLLKQEVLSENFEKIEIPMEKTVIEAKQPNGYRYFRFALNNDEPMWIDFIQFKSKIDFQLHHATITVRNVEFEDPAKGFVAEGGHMLVGTTGIWKYYNFEKSSAGFYIPKKAWFYIEAHYEGSGKDEDEQFVAVIHKFKKRPQLGLFTVALIIPPNHIKVPPNTKDYHVEKKELMLLDEDVSLVAVNAHMHSRGDKILFQIKKKKSGRKTDILRIDRYLHKLQRAYFLDKPLVVNKGDELQFNAWYDNTKANVNNVDSDSYAYGGLTSKEEMAVGTVWMTGRSEFVEQLMKNYLFK